MKTNIRQVIIWFILFHVCSITVIYILYYGYGYWVDEIICITSMLSATGIMAIYYILKDATRQFFHHTNQRRDLKKWILCDKRLPEENGESLVTIDDGSVVITQFTDEVGFLTGWPSESEVVAWQPLPEPYKSKGE